MSTSAASILSPRRVRWLIDEGASQVAAFSERMKNLQIPSSLMNDSIADRSALFTSSHLYFWGWTVGIHIFFPRLIPMISTPNFISIFSWYIPLLCTLSILSERRLERLRKKQEVRPSPRRPKEKRTWESDHRSVIEWLRFWMIRGAAEAFKCILRWASPSGTPELIRELELIFYLWIYCVPFLQQAYPSGMREVSPASLVSPLLRRYSQAFLSVVGRTIPHHVWNNNIVIPLARVLDMATAVRVFKRSTATWLLHLVQEGRCLVLPAVTLFTPGGFLTSYGVAYVQYAQSIAQSGVALYDVKASELWLQYWILHAFIDSLLQFFSVLLWWVPFSKHIIFVFWCYLSLPHTIEVWYEELENELRMLGLLPSDGTTGQHIKATQTAQFLAWVIEILPKAETADPIPDDFSLQSLITARSTASSHPGSRSLPPIEVKTISFSPTTRDRETSTRELCEPDLGGNSLLRSVPEIRPEEFMLAEEYEREDSVDIRIRQKVREATDSNGNAGITESRQLSYLRAEGHDLASSRFASNENRENASFDYQNMAPSRDELDALIEIESTTYSDMRQRYMVDDPNEEYQAKNCPLWVKSSNRRRKGGVLDDTSAGSNFGQPRDGASPARSLSQVPSQRLQSRWALSPGRRKKTGVSEDISMEFNNPLTYDPDAADFSISPTPVQPRLPSLFPRSPNRKRKVGLGGDLPVDTDSNQTTDPSLAGHPSSLEAVQPPRLPPLFPRSPSNRRRMPGEEVLMDSSTNQRNEPVFPDHPSSPEVPPINRWVRSSGRRRKAGTVEDASFGPTADNAMVIGSHQRAPSPLTLDEQCQGLQQTVSGSIAPDWPGSPEVSPSQRAPFWARSPGRRRRNGGVEDSSFGSVNSKTAEQQASLGGSSQRAPAPVLLDEPYQTMHHARSPRSNSPGPLRGVLRSLSGSRRPESPPRSFPSASPQPSMGPYPLEPIGRYDEDLLTSVDVSVSTRGRRNRNADSSPPRRAHSPMRLRPRPPRPTRPSRKGNRVDD